MNYTLKISTTTNIGPNAEEKKKPFTFLQNLEISSLFKLSNNLYLNVNP